MDYDVKCLLSQDNQLLSALFHYSSYNVIITINMSSYSSYNVIITINMSSYSSYNVIITINMSSYS